MGLVLSTLIVMAPPIAASFFQGTLAQFSAYSAFGNIGARQAGSQPPGTPGYQAPAPIDNSSSTAQTRLPSFNNHSGSSPAGAIAHQDTTKLKNFNSNTVG
jgi:type IV secretion system protein VirB6